MKDQWEEKVSCATTCHGCGKSLQPDEERILSVYSHEPICLTCKEEEEGRTDYAQVSKNTIGECMAQSELTMSDPAGFCFHHFYPYKC